MKYMSDLAPYIFVYCLIFAIAICIPILWLYSISIHLNDVSGTITFCNETVQICEYKYDGNTYEYYLNTTFPCLFNTTSCSIPNTTIEHYDKHVDPFAIIIFILLCCIILLPCYIWKILPLLRNYTGEEITNNTELETIV